MRRPARFRRTHALAAVAWSAWMSPMPPMPPMPQIDLEEKMTHLTVTPQGATALTERGFDDPNFQRCDGCDSGFIVEEPDQYWPCPYCSHSNAARPKAGAVCPSCRRHIVDGWNADDRCPDCGSSKRKFKRDGEIMALRHQGLKLREIGERYGISIARVSQIIKRVKHGTAEWDSGVGHESWSWICNGIWLVRRSCHLGRPDCRVGDCRSPLCGCIWDGGRGGGVGGCGRDERWAISGPLSGGPMADG